MKASLTAPLVLAGLISVLSSQTLAISDACALSQKALPQSHKMTVEQFKTYQTKLEKECALTKTYRDVRSILNNNFGHLSLEKITEYQAMRFVVRADYERARQSNTLITKVYQIKRSDYSLPEEQRSSVIWDNWEAGMKQLQGSREKVLRGQGFTIDDLTKVHIGFFTLSKEEGDDAWNPQEGLFKQENENDNYWWSFNSAAEAAEAKRIVSEINAEYRELGLTGNSGNADFDHVLRVKNSLKRQSPDKKDVVEYVDAIYSGDTRANRRHVDSIFKFINVMFAQALKDEHMLWNGRLLTPMEVGYLAQKFYVGVHPFAEGNGRTSRYILELFMTSFDMPHGSSGDLMSNDVLMTFKDYYELAYTSNAKLINNMIACINQYKQNNPAAIDYNCRILK